jgi:glycosyltransferase involved in cell wall biosynthesis
MKLVFANKYWFLKGGAERSLFDLRDLLESRGHEVVPFAMRGDHDLPTPWRKYFVSAVETERVRFSLGGMKTAGRMLWSFEAARKFGRVLDKAKPDLVHLHNIYHQISPSIIPEARKRGLPVVLTAHDYKRIAPNYSLFHDGAICERTKPDKYWAAVGHKCVKGSAAASALAALEMTVNRGVWRDGVDRIIAPSRFMAAILEEYGVAKDRIAHVPHFIDAGAWTPTEGGDVALYVGRLSPEKGVDTLVRAAARAKDVPVRIVGTGPEEKRLKALAAKLGASNVVFAGFKSGEELRREYARARYLVVPSVWYEVFGLIALEAYASGKPVIASQLGGLAEMVKDGETGLYATAGDADDLAEQMMMLWDEPDTAIDMGRAGRAWVERDFTPAKQYDAIIKVYESAKREAASR